MSDTLQALLEAGTPKPWSPYFTVHGDPFVVMDLRRPMTTIVARVGTAPDDYGRADARLLALAPSLAAFVLSLSPDDAATVGRLSKVLSGHEPLPEHDGDDCSCGEEWEPTHIARALLADLRDAVAAKVGEAG